jgi:hypothetical protein
MEPQEDVIANDSDKSLIQDETKMNVDKQNSSYVNKIDVSNNPFYHLIERQAKEFEESIKRMSLELQNSYKEYVAQQKELTKVETNSIDIEKIYKKLKEKLISQSHLIDALRARIEELETDSIIKDQNIKNLQDEFNDLKKNLSVPEQENKKSVSLLADENVKDSEIPKQNDSLFQDDKKNGSFSTDEDSDEVFIYRGSSNIVNNSNLSKTTYAETDSSQIQVPILKKLHSEIQQVIIANHRDNIKLRSFKFLKSSYTINVLTQYTKTPEFNSLDKKSKRYINYQLKSMMSEDLKTRRNQNLDDLKV